MLIDLDRIDGRVVSKILEFLLGRIEGVGEPADAIPQDILEADQDGEGEAFLADRIDDFDQIDGAVFCGCLLYTSPSPRD